jgi:hypothetical protein
MSTILARLAAPFLVIGFLAVAQASAAPPPASAPPAADSRAHDAGTISGEIVSIDYQSETMVVNAGGRGKTEILVPPSASIQGKDDEFFTIADLKAGARVEVYASQTGGKLIAQIIKLL